MLLYLYDYVYHISPYLLTKCIGLYAVSYWIFVIDIFLWHVHMHLSSDPSLSFYLSDYVYVGEIASVTRGPHCSKMLKGDVYKQNISGHKTNVIKSWTYCRLI